MKKYFFVLTLIALSACSSTPKEEAASAPESVSVQEEPAPVSKPEPVKSEDKPVAPVEPSMDSGAGFPDVTGTERSTVDCASGASTRKISVIDTSEKHCGVVYHRGDEKRTVAYAKFDMSYCDNVQNKIKGNLESAGFNCGGGAAPAAQPAEQSQQQPQGN